MGIFELSLADDNNKEEWMKYIYSCQSINFYHDFRWKKVLEESFDHRCFYLIAQEDEKTVGIFPLVFIKSRIMASSLISIPFFNYGGILADNEDIATLLLNKAIDLSKEMHAKYIEIRSLKKLNLPLVTREHKVTMWLELSDTIEAQWEKLDGKVRNQLRKAQNSGLTIKYGKTELLDEFYRLFAHNMRDLGTPVLGKKFFENILKYFSVESNILIVERENKAIAGAFTLSHGDTIEIPWASSLRTFNKLCPNEFMYWEVIRYAITCGLSIFDLGRCTKDSGTYKFKKQWNPQIKQLYWQYWAKRESGLPTDNPKKSKFSILIAIWRKLPLFITNRLGPLIAKEISMF